MNLFSSCLVIGAGLMVLTFCSCQKKTASADSATPPVQAKQPYVKTNFIAPDDSAVTLNKLRLWMQCNPLLDSLSYFYQDSFKLKGAANLVKYQEEFTEAQDRICVLAGLNGYAEYLWIMRNLGIAKNKSLLDSLKLALY